ncbi:MULTISPECIES: CpsB/CapC family capsule biosynthesis tyrosine phosphatase [unclassified Neptuniibacter]|uniref:tyrosine-protein phosphatase n=1 Tax=unclassified Neptuniibacter TaxID=2630693 RepID=UPI000C5BE4C7|nr:MULTISPECIES: CpsB/CapC family capsule biosynthesis tyrosine phosphatase [unclassified Neptuniibacter]MAY43404.1 capsular biosynthesis protein [Oceanospirillaceae bacterium]|tara:strand:+ start:9723 stop:10442 length:720 start_codon:yes stop_codon:yes gene_type:complete
MIDLHSHLLPGIDDGASSVEEALSLARIAVADGITHMAMTPHVHPGRFDNTQQTILPVFNEFQAALDEHEINLCIHAAGEVRLSAEMLGMFAVDQLPFLGEWDGQRVMLLELPHSHVPPGSDKLVQWLMARGVVPMIAHPERNKGIMSDVSKLAPFVELGCLFQLTAMSVAGNFGVEAKRLSDEMLDKGWVTVIASDAHNSDRRPPVLSEAVEAASQLIGQAEARRLVWDNPAKIIGLL